MSKCTCTVLSMCTLAKSCGPEIFWWCISYSSYVEFSSRRGCVAGYCYCLRVAKFKLQVVYTMTEITSSKPLAGSSFVGWYTGGVLELHALWVGSLKLDILVARSICCCCDWCYLSYRKVWSGWWEICQFSEFSRYHLALCSRLWMGPRRSRLVDLKLCMEWWRPLPHCCDDPLPWMSSP